MEHEALVGQFSHLNNLPREKDALHTLKKIASLVKPIMRARNFKVGTLAEFYPNEQNLLGINMNRGQKICLRLRYPGDVNQFLPLEQVVDTMLHELSHNVIGPHNEQFHALWDQQRKEYEALIAKGYTGEGFLSQGHQLGGRRLPMHEARRLARVAAEKRKTLNSGSGQRLGGRPVLKGTDIRKVIVDAIERRSTVLKGCGAEKKDDREIKDLADQATANGFKTKAEEEEANDRAIAQALWELVQEDQEKEYGDSYVPSTPSNPTGNGGGKVGTSKSPSKPQNPNSSSSSSSATTGLARQPPKHVSRLVSCPPTKKPKPAQENDSSMATPNTTPAKPQSIIDLTSDPSPPPSTPILTGWTCEICTLHNPLNYLSCDACTVERPPHISIQIAEQNQRQSSSAKQKPVSKPKQMSMPSRQQPAIAKTWTCKRCTTVMEDKWWTCNTCGVMKESS
ncbi:hypothetical protein HYALB_00013506 [Hymenoscyphus albidus]|uniref:WLM domain-containing protein n=1 Tax=Hymenoscyphus albidus TaxID=595503 RepID=A0A9N9LZ59_9HELO|nr:hypothetical protein HYALB_00013506 [Hymenoscyphus albidus]